MWSRIAIAAAVLAASDPPSCAKITEAINTAPSASAKPLASSPPPPTLTPEDLAMAEAKDLCAKGDCEDAHDRLALALPANAPQRQSQDFKNVEVGWATAAIAGAATDPDVAARKKELTAVMASPYVDAATKANAQKALAALANVPVGDGGGASAGTAAAGAAGSPLTKEQQQATTKRDALLPKAQAGKAGRGELKDLRAACKVLADNDCLALVKKKLGS